MLSRSMSLVARTQRLALRTGLRSFGGAAGGVEVDAARERALQRRSERGIQADEPAWDAHEHEMLHDIEDPKRKWNDWETWFYVLFWGSFLLVGFGEAFRPDHGPESWARDEVAAREARLTQDEEVEYGTCYSLEQPSSGGTYDSIEDALADEN